MPRVNLSMPGVIAASYQGAAPADTTAKYRGQARLAQGIGDVGGVMQEFAQRSADLKNRADEVRVEQAIRTEEKEFATWQESEPDETKWIPESQKRTEALNERIAALDLSPAVRREAQLRLSAWTEDRGVTVANQAERYANKRHDDVLVSQMQDAAEMGDKETIDSIMDERVILGTIDKGTAEATRHRMYEVADVAQATRLTNEDPLASIEALEAQTEGGKWKNYKAMSETARLTALRSAKNALETMREENAQEIGAMILSGQETGRGGGIDERIERDLAEKKLTAHTAANLRAFARGQRSPEQMAADGSRLWNEAMTLDPSSPDYVQRNQRIRAETHALSPEVRDPIIDTLNAKDRNAVPEITRHVFSMLENDYRANTFGNVQTYSQSEIDRMNHRERKAAGNPQEGDPKDRASRQQADAILFRYQLALRQYLNANPKATANDILEYRASLTASDTQAQLGQMAIDALSGAVQ